MRFYPCLAARFSTWCGHSTLSSFRALWSVRLCHSHPPTHPTALRRFCAVSSPPLPTSLSSSSTVPTQNFFKCLIFPPLASFLQAPSHLFVHRFFIPLQPLPPFRLLPTHLPLFLLALPQHFVCISPISRCSVLLLMQTDLYFINLF